MEGVYKEEEVKGNQKELEDPKLEVADLKQKLALETEVNEVLSSKLQEAESISTGLRNKVDEKESEVSTLVKAHKVEVTRGSKFRTELEGHLTAFRSATKILQCQKRNLEAQLESKTIEAKQLDEKNKELGAHAFEREQVFKEKGDEIGNLSKKLKDNEYHLKSKIEELTMQFSILQPELDHFHAQEGEVEANLGGKGNLSSSQINSLRDQANTLQHGLESIGSQKAESDAMLESENKELSQFLIHVNALKDELSKKTLAEQKMLKEKEALLLQVMDLKSDVNSLHRQNNDLEQQMMSKNHENGDLREENERSHVKILELEGQLSSKEDELPAFRNCEGGHLQEDVNQLKNHKILSDSLDDGERQEYLKSLSQKEDQNVELRSKIDELQKTLAEREAVLNELEEELKQLKRRSTGSKQALERKLECLAEEFRKKLEDNIRLLFQRIKVAEKIHYENKDNYTRTKERLEQENASLAEKLAAYEAEVMKLRDNLEPGNKTIETMDGKLEDTENSLSWISNATNELAFAKTCATEVSNETEEREQDLLLVEKVQKLEERLNKEEGEKLNLIKFVKELKKRVLELEKDIEEKDERLVGLGEEQKAIRRLGEEQRETIRQLGEQRREAIWQLEGEKKEAIRQLGEEKREAIKQLCLLIDHHRSRCEGLRQLISNVAVRKKRRNF